MSIDCHKLVVTIFMGIALEGNNLACVKEGNHLICCECFLLLTQIPTFSYLLALKV